MSVIKEVETRIAKDWQTMAITTRQQAQYLAIVRYLGDCPATTTYMVGLHMREACSIIRGDLRRMEKLEYVLADSNGSNNICWRLKP